MSTQQGTDRLASVGGEQVRAILAAGADQADAILATVTDEAENARVRAILAADVGYQLHALLESVERGEMSGPPSAVAYLRGAVATLDSITGQPGAAA